MAGNQKCLLVIDDEDDICQVIQAKFEHLGYKVLIAHSVHEGYQKIEKGAPDCVFLDICIPGSEGGLACLRGIRSYNHKNPHEQDRIRKTPVVMITGAGTVMQALFDREEISGFIEKPFDLADLQARVEQIVWKR